MAKTKQALVGTGRNLAMVFSCDITWHPYTAGVADVLEFLATMHFSLGYFFNFEQSHEILPQYFLNNTLFNFSFLSRFRVRCPAVFF